MDYEVRHIRREERPLLEDFLYEAVFAPEGFEGQIPRSVIYDDPKCRAAYLGFGTSALETSVPAKGMYLRRGYRVSGEAPSRRHVGWAGVLGRYPCPVAKNHPA